MLLVFLTVFSVLNCGSAKIAGKQSREDLLAEKTNQMLEWNSRRPIIKLSGDKWNTYVKSGPKNYSVVLMLTALAPRFKCAICQEANSEFEVLARSWRYSPQYSSKLFFALVDYEDGESVFRALKISQAPIFIHVPAKGKSKKADNMNLQRQGFSAEAIARWVNERTDINIRVFRPPNYSGTVGVALLVLMVAGLLYMKRNSLEFLSNKIFWSAAALCFVLVFISGQMWNQIRGAGFMYRNPQTGQVGYFSGSSQSQFIVETYIVALIYMAIAGGFILLVEANRVAGEKKRIFALAGLGVLVLFFSLLLSIFRSKYQGYPYSFLL